MKAIMIAAGLGRRMGPMTAELPKCLAIQWNGKTLFEQQLKTIRECGIREVIVVRGYCGDKFPDLTDVRYFWNRDFQTNNILESLMCAKSEISGDTVILYSDIWFQADVLKAIMNSPGDIAAGVDLQWQGVYEGRTDHPLQEAEIALFDSNCSISKIGKIALETSAEAGEFVGIVRVNARGAAIFQEHYDKIKQLYQGKAFQRAHDFKKAYLTDFLQDLIRIETPVTAVPLRGGWREIDTVQDFQNLLKHLEKQHHNWPNPKENQNEYPA